MMQQSLVTSHEQLVIDSEINKTVVRALQGFKVLVGGAPVTSAFAKQIGADVFAPDAATAVDVARGLAA